MAVTPSAVDSSAARAVPSSSRLRRPRRKRQAMTQESEPSGRAHDRLLRGDRVRGSGRRAARRRAGRARPRGGTGPRTPAARRPRDPSTVPSLRLIWVTRTAGGQRVGIDREAVVLAGDRDLAGGEVAHRLVAAVVAELELEGAAAEGEAEELVARGRCRGRAVGARPARATASMISRQRLGVARTVRQHDAVDAAGRSTTDAGVRAGSTVERARRARSSERRMLVLTPKS